MLKYGYETPETRSLVGFWLALERGINWHGLGAGRVWWQLVFGRVNFWGWYNGDLLGESQVLISILSEVNMFATFLAVLAGVFAMVMISLARRQEDERQRNADK